MQQWMRELHAAAGAGSDPIEISIPSGTHVAHTGSNSTSYTFSSLDFGADDAGRQIFAGIVTCDVSNNNTPSSVTIGGVSATEVASLHIVTGGANCYISLWVAEPSGTSGSVVVTGDGILEAGACFIYRVFNADTTPSETNTDQGSDPLTATINCDEGGAVIAVMGIRSAFGGSNTWSGVDDLEHTQVNMGGENRHAGANAEAFATAQSSLSVNCNPSNSSMGDYGCLWVSLTPA